MTAPVKTRLPKGHTCAASVQHHSPGSMTGLRNLRAGTRSVREQVNSPWEVLWANSHWRWRDHLTTMPEQAEEILCLVGNRKWTMKPVGLVSLNPGKQRLVQTAQGGRCRTLQQSVALMVKHAAEHARGALQRIPRGPCRIRHEAADHGLCKMHLPARLEPRQHFVCKVRAGDTSEQHAVSTSDLCWDLGEPSSAHSSPDGLRPMSTQV